MNADEEEGDDEIGAEKSSKKRIAETTDKKDEDEMKEFISNTCSQENVPSAAKSLSLPRSFRGNRWLEEAEEDPDIFGTKEEIGMLRKSSNYIPGLFAEH